MLEWGAVHRRDLPWRHTRDPWRVLVSEVMLQQTQVDRVIAYYSAFLRAYPRAVDCARARPGDVVRLWSGLGYNRRALNLHRTATAIAGEHGGAVPADESSLRALPGIGAYTARAVLSFAFEADVATVDTNVVRVLSRGVAGAGLTLRQAQSLADRLLPAGHSWEFNQSMFDLGATVCTAAAPACGLCPLRHQCRWKRGGLSAPDPWRASPSVRAQAPFAGSDRQGRGRLVQALRQGAVSQEMLASACGWPDDAPRARADLGVARGRGVCRVGRRSPGHAPPALMRAGCDSLGPSGTEELHDVAVHHVWLLHVHEVAGVLYDHHLRPLGHEVERVADGAQQHAPVIATVQVQRRLRRGRQRGILLVGQLGIRQPGVEHGPVVPDGRGHVLGVPDGLLDRATSKLAS